MTDNIADALNCIFKFLLLITFTLCPFRGVVSRIVAELKQILKKDFNRRMVEGTAFKGNFPLLMNF